MGLRIALMAANWFFGLFAIVAAVLIQVATTKVKLKPPHSATFDTAMP